MPKTISIDDAERNLRAVLESLPENEPITVVDETGAPVAQISAPGNGAQNSKAQRKTELKAWIEEMKDVAERIDEAWIGEKSALEQLEEDRSRLDGPIGVPDDTDATNSSSSTSSPD